MNVDDFEKLKELREKGALTDKEFEEQRQLLVRDVVERNDGGDIIERSPVPVKKASALKGGKKALWYWYAYVLRHWPDFSGRAGRAEYWSFYACNLLMTFATGALDGFFGMKHGVSGVYSFLVFIPELAVAVRRLHDTGKSGKLLLAPILLAGVLVALALPSLIRNEEPSGLSLVLVLAAIVAFFGFGIYVLYLLIKKGDEGENKYGDLPY